MLLFMLKKTATEKGYTHRLKKKGKKSGCYITHPNLVAGMTKITLLSFIWGGLPRHSGWHGILIAQCFHFSPILTNKKKLIGLTNWFPHGLNVPTRLIVLVISAARRLLTPLLSSYYEHSSEFASSSKKGKRNMEGRCKWAADCVPVPQSTFKKKKLKQAISCL